MDIKLNNVLPEPLPLKGSPETSNGGKNVRAGSFADVLQQVREQQAIKFSAHAARRLEERNIILSKVDVDKIAEAVNLAASKGVRDSLIIYGELALVASIKNRTVVTALGREAATNRVFTNIDSAVIIK